MNINYHGAGILFYHVDKKGEVFVLLGKKSYAGKEWSIFGGGWEKKDGYYNDEKNLLKTAVRETQEEVGITVPLSVPKKIWEKKIPFYSWETYVVGLKNKLFIKRFSPEIARVGWFNIDRLPDRCYPSLYPQIEIIRSRLKK